MCVVVTVTESLFFCESVMRNNRPCRTLGAVGWNGIVAQDESNWCGHASTCPRTGSLTDYNKLVISTTFYLQINKTCSFIYLRSVVVKMFIYSKFNNQ